MKKELIIRSNSDTVDFAMLNDGKLVELDKEIGKNKFSVGDIYVAKIRKIIPNHFLLVPGIGAQGGNLQEVAKYGMNTDCGILVNSSRGIIYAGKETDFAEKARRKRKEK